MDGVVPVDTAAGLISYSHLGVNVITLKRELFLETVIDTSAGSRSAVINGIGANVSSALTIANGKKIFASTPFRMEISGGPIDPVGVKFTLDVDLRPAFSDIDGNTYYKKTIITSTVPDQ